MLSVSRLLYEKNNMNMGKMAAAVRDAKLEYLNAVAIINQAAAMAKAMGQARANDNPKNVATPLPPLNLNQTG